MKISVVIPTYKPGPYLQECLESIERQTLPKCMFEVIVVLNGCNEPWKGQLEQMLSAYSFSYRLLQLDTPGVSNARNIGIAEAKGEYLTFLDDDDWVSDSFLEQLLEKASTDTVVTSTVFGYRDESGEYIEDYYLARKFNRIRSHGGRATQMQARSFLSSSCFKLIHRDIIGSRRYDVSYRLGEDALFMALISDRISAVVTSAPSAVYYRRLRSTSASHTSRGTGFFALLGNAFRLGWEYTFMYLHHPLHYNVLFFGTRILAGFSKRLFCYS